MTASSASTAESTRVRARVGAVWGLSQRPAPLPPGPPVLVSRCTVSVEELRSAVAGRAEHQAARRLQRRQRRLLAALGLSVIALVLILTVVVLSVVH